MTDHTAFTKERFAAFRENNRDGPIQMLNLIKLHDDAQYEDSTKVSGAEAYATYGRESAPVFEKLGGKIIWRGAFEQMLIGPDAERWDICFIAEYASANAFAEMIRDPQYRAAMLHRQAGVKDSRLVRLAPSDAGHSF